MIFRSTHLPLVACTPILLLFAIIIPYPCFRDLGRHSIVERLRMDFSLPAESGQGRPLTPQEFQALLEREAPAVFFSQDLCARYFTYTREGETHFVLFDDADTLQQKLRLGSRMGFAAAFLMYPEVQDLLPQLFPSRRTGSGAPT